MHELDDDTRLAKILWAAENLPSIRTRRELRDSITCAAQRIYSDRHRQPLKSVKSTQGTAFCRLGRLKAIRSAPVAMFPTVFILLTGIFVASLIWPSISKVPAVFLGPPRTGSSFMSPPMSKPELNLLQNPDFSQYGANADTAPPDTVSSLVTSSPTDPTEIDTWVISNSSPHANTTAELRKSTGPNGGKMLRVHTNGPDNGIMQVLTGGRGFDHVTASVWVYVETGAVTVGTSDGSHGHSVTSTQQKSWELLNVPDSGARWPVNEIFISSSHLSDDVTFYIDYASVQFSS